MYASKDLIIFQVKYREVFFFVYGAIAAPPNVELKCLRNKLSQAGNLTLSSICFGCLLERKPPATEGAFKVLFLSTPTKT